MSQTKYRVRDLTKIKNIILDLDETIISAVEVSSLLQDKSKMVSFSKKTDQFKMHYMDTDYIITERPYVQEFLDFMFKHYNVSVWTAASKEYALFVIEKVILAKPSRKIDYILFSDHCDRSYSLTKCMKYLDRLFHFDHYDKDNTLLIDDNNETYSRQNNQVIRIKPFVCLSKSSKKDNELKLIMNFLKK
jgi:TFIIF-interacting CTD phosphatase-like protein